jgi:DNA-binding CsgD family transcriptional regulator
MDESAELLRIVGFLYDSVIEEAMWPVALQALTDFTGGTGAGEVVANPMTGMITRTQTVSVDPSFRELYLEYYSTKEVRLPPAIHFPVGAVIVENMLIERKELERSEIYGDLLTPADVPHFMFAWLQKQPHQLQTISIQGSKRHGAFQKDAMDRYSLVMPHLVRALRLRDRLVLARQTESAHHALFEGLPFGVVLFDETERVIHASVVAETLLRTADGLYYSKGRIRARNVADDQRLQQVLHGVCHSRARRTVAGDTVIARRSNNPSPLVANIFPVNALEHSAFSSIPAGFMLIVDPEQSPRSRESVIQRAFVLTRAEATLANTLFEGATLRDAARLLNRSINTCKSQLKSIFAKTGCGSQVQLAKKLLLVAIGRVSCHLAFILTCLSYVDIGLDTDG